VPERTFDELKRFVRFAADDEEALRALAGVAAPHLRAISDEFYLRLNEHEETRQILDQPGMVERLKGMLCEWMGTLLGGPWDAAYAARRARVGHVHVVMNVPQRYMFATVNIIRAALTEIAERHHTGDDARRRRAVTAISRILDLELAVIMETYREAHVERVRRLERLEIDALTRELELSEARYEEIVENGPALVVTCEPDGQIVLFNGRCEALTGLARHRAMQLTWDEVFGRGVQAQREAVLAGQKVSPVELPTLSAGGATRWVRWQLTTIPGTHGPLVCAIGMDTTEERAFAASSQRTARLASLGLMAAGLAHEIRNPLNAAELQLMLVRRRLARLAVPDEPSREAAELAAGEMKRLAALVEEFLQFARPQPLRLARIDLRAVAEAVIALVQPQANDAGATLTLLPGPPVHIELDEERMKQVLLNLVRNGLDAAATGGQVRVTVTGDEGRALLEVADDGPGVPREAPIFEPFFTTKQGGTGLGLAIVHRIVGDHGGRVEVERHEGWTVFSVALPKGGA
jgi:PAS domain S-box-containing protein